MKRVEVEWVDSLLYHDGWQDAEFYTEMLKEASANRQFSVGYLAAEDERGMVIVQSRDADTERLCNATFIPSASIVAVNEIGQGARLDE